MNVTLLSLQIDEMLIGEERAEVLVGHVGKLLLMLQVNQLVRGEGRMELL